MTLSEKRHRILIIGRKTGGYDVGKINELGTEVAREDADRAIDSIRRPNDLKMDAFLLVAGAAGGNGLGVIRNNDTTN